MVDIRHIFIRNTVDGKYNYEPQNCWRSWILLSRIEGDGILIYLLTFDNLGLGGND